MDSITETKSKLVLMDNCSEFQRADFTPSLRRTVHHRVHPFLREIFLHHLLGPRIFHRHRLCSIINLQHRMWDRGFEWHWSYILHGNKPNQRAQMLNSWNSRHVDTMKYECWRLCRHMYLPTKTSSSAPTSRWSTTTTTTTESSSSSSAAHILFELTTPVLKFKI